MCDWETAATTVSSSDILGGFLSLNLKGFIPLPALPCNLQRSLVMCLHNPAPKTRVKFQGYAPPWGFYATLLCRANFCQNITYPLYECKGTPNLQVQTQENGITFKGVLPCIKCSVHIQNCKACMYKP